MDDPLIRLCAIEAHYWAEVEDEKLIQFAMGARGAASNICAAVLRGLTPEQFAEEVKKRHATR